MLNKGETGMPAPRITVDLLRRWIEAGYGQGHGDNYRPFIQIKRWNASPVSTQTAGSVPPLTRRGAFLSFSEWELALLMSWVGVADVREQYPVWPWSHHHPLFGIDECLDHKLPIVRGMQAVCDDAGIDLGTFPGTRVPYIWTLDQVLTVPNQKGDHPTCTIVSVKPINDHLLDPDPLARVMEKLEVERRFAEEIGATYFVADHEQFGETLREQLVWLSTSAALRPNDPRNRLLQSFLDDHGDSASDYPPSEWVRRIQSDNRASHADAWYVVHHILWNQHIDCDLRKTIRLDRLIPTGGQQYRLAMQAQLRGESQ